MTGEGKKNVVERVEVGVRSCAIQSVVVYKDRAEVKRVVPARLSAGENEVVVNDMAECVDKNSVRVEGQGKAMITDVIYSSETSSSEEQTSSGSREEYERLKGEIKEGEKELKHLQFLGEVLDKEKELLKKFADHICKTHSVSGEGESLAGLVEASKVAAVMGFLQRYETKVASLDERIAGVKRDRQKLEERLKVLRTNAEKVNPEAKVTSTETIRSLRVGLEASEDTDVTLIVSYVVSNASWNSAYDVRVFTKDRAMKVQYYGLIKQSTGEDWDDTNVSLSTAQPSIGGSAPTLPTRLIRFKRPLPRPRPYSQPMSFGPPGGAIPTIGFEPEFLGGQERFRAISGSALRSSALKEYDPTIEDCYIPTAYAGDGDYDRLEPQRRRSVSPPPPAVDIAVAKVTTGLFNTTYAIPRATTIPADNTEHKVTVALVDLVPEFHYVSVPRLSPYSFLQARTKNSSQYTMLAGPANIFLDNNFIAKSEISDVSPNEEFTSSLGVDQSVRITCQPVAVVHGSAGRLTKNKVVTYSHTFLVKNTKVEPVDIQVSEQVPLSTDERIKVTVTEPDAKKAGVKCPLPYGHALLNDSHNLEWHATVVPDTELELRLVYSVEYPLQDDVEGLPKN